MRNLPLAWIVMLALATTTGCKAKKKGDEGGGSAAPRKDLMTPQEKQRGVDACTALKEKICACSERRPDDAALKERCHMKQGNTLDLFYGVIEDPKSSEDSMLRAHVGARKFIAKCIEETAQLPSLGCQ